MTPSLLAIVIFLTLLVCLPFAIKWVKQRALGNSGQRVDQSRFISAVAVGPHQSVVTVEAGPESARVWLTVGVTQQSITCLHVAPVGASRRKIETEQSEPPIGGKSHTQMFD